MKIKELFENDGVPGTIRIRYWFKENIDSSRDVYRQYIPNIQEFIKKQYVNDVNIGDDRIWVELHNIKQSVYSNKFLMNKIIEDIQKEINEYFDIDYNSSVLELMELPTTEIDFDVITIDAPNSDFIAYKGISLHNVHKLLKCKTLFINASYIKSDALGLLKMSGEVKMIGLVKDAMHIINKHLKSKDIVACSEELIEAGYKEFAKL